jgi:hypothetical protein
LFHNKDRYRAEKDDTLQTEYAGDFVGMILPEHRFATLFAAGGTVQQTPKLNVCAQTTKNVDCKRQKMSIAPCQHHESETATSARSRFTHGSGDHFNVCGGWTMGLISG